MSDAENDDRGSGGVASVTTACDRSTPEEESCEGPMYGLPLAEASPARWDDADDEDLGDREHLERGFGAVMFPARGSSAALLSGAR